MSSPTPRYTILVTIVEGELNKASGHVGAFPHYRNCIFFRPIVSPPVNSLLVPFLLQPNCHSLFCLAKDAFVVGVFLKNIFCCSMELDAPTRNRNNKAIRMTTEQLVPTGSMR